MGKSFGWSRCQEENCVLVGFNFSASPKPISGLGVDPIDSLIGDQHLT